MMTTRLMALILTALVQHQLELKHCPDSSLRTSYHVAMGIVGQPKGLVDITILPMLDVIDNVSCPRRGG